MIIKILEQFFSDYPRKINRLFNHIRGIFQNTALSSNGSSLAQNPFAYLIDLIFYFMDLIGIGEIYDISSGLIKFNTRAMNENELRIAKSVYSDAINYNLVRIDENPLIGNENLTRAYVGIYTINVFGKLTDELLVHELIHVWQYQQFGSVYIPRALRAQRSKQGYDYGGVEALETKKGMQDFNYEQQGEIATDYYRLLQARPPKWIKNANIKMFKPFIGEIQRSRGVNSSDMA